MNKRMGIIYINVIFFTKTKKEIKRAFKKVKFKVLSRKEDNQKIGFLGTSPFFRKINPEESIPSYYVMVGYHENGKKTYRMEEIK